MLIVREGIVFEFLGISTDKMPLIHSAVMNSGSVPSGRDHDLLKDLVAKEFFVSFVDS